MENWKLQTKIHPDILHAEDSLTDNTYNIAYRDSPPFYYLVLLLLVEVFLCRQDAGKEYCCHCNAVSSCFNNLISELILSLLFRRDDTCDIAGFVEAISSFFIKHLLCCLIICLLSDGSFCHFSIVAFCRLEKLQLLLC